MVCLTSTWGHRLAGPFVLIVNKYIYTTFIYSKYLIKVSIFTESIDSKLKNIFTYVSLVCTLKNKK
jgi:hypothetical protein